MAATMESEHQTAIGARIRALRGRRTQPSIADEVGVTLRAYQAWESGASTPAWANLEKLATLFEVSTDYLLNGDDAPPRGSQLDRIEQLLAAAADQLEVLTATVSDIATRQDDLEAAVLLIAGAEQDDARGARANAGHVPGQRARRSKPRSKSPAR